MQGSFWKTVAIVGVIGIGSLAILEVQHRLPGRHSEQDTAESQALARQIVESGEKTVDAALEDSEFDRMMAAASDTGATGTPAASFELTEPAQTPSDPGLEQFYGTEPVAAQANTPPVDTSVSLDQLARGGNPFDEDSQTVAASYQKTGNETVQPAGFVDENPFPAFSGNEPPESVPADAELKPFRRDDALAPTPEDSGTFQPEPAPDADFQLFSEDSGDASGSPAEPADATAQLAATPRQMKFFGADDETGPQERSGLTVPNSSMQDDNFPKAATAVADPAGSRVQIADAAPANARTDTEFSADADTNTASAGPNRRTAQFFEGDPAPLQPTPEPPASSAPAPFDGGDRMFDSDSGQNSPERPPADSRDEGTEFNQPASPFDQPPAPADRGSATGSDAGSRQPVEDNGLFREDLVPTPRDPAPRDPAPLAVPDRGFSSDVREPQNFPEDRVNEPPPLSPAPSLKSTPAESTSPLPFVEDLDEAEPSMIPDLDRSPSLSIPQPDNSFTPRPPPRSPLNYPSSPEPDNEPIEVRPFPSPSRDSSTPSGRASDGVRDFDGGQGNFNGGERTFDGRGQEFTDDLPADGRSTVPSGSRSRDFDSGIRQVSGVMRPNLVLQKTAPENATVGTPLDYRILVRNEGDASAYEVMVEDEVPNGATVDGARPQPELDRATSKLIWKFERIDPGETQEIAVRITPTGEGTLDGVATVKFKARVKATTVITAPRLRIQMRGPDEVRLGEEVTYRYVITNEGSGIARDVYVRTVLPKTGGLKHPAGSDLEYEIQALKPNEQREISLAVVAAEPGEHRAEAEVSAIGGNKAQAAWRTNVVGAQLKIVRRGPGRRFVGRSATYENIISNETNFDALDARVVEQVPEGMKFLSASRGGRYDEKNRTVTWRINRIGAGLQENLQIELMPTSAGSRESVVAVFENAGLRGEDHVSTTVVEDLHNVSADITQLDGPIAMGETFGFTITVDNRGTADATDVELVVDVPEEIQVIGAGSREVQAKLLEGNVVQYSMLVRIPPDQQQAFELKLKGVRPVRNGVVEASVRYAQMERPLVVSESVTIYEDR
ncbi:MAG: hypothetical protein RIK87_22845 [Fuerstiella sp.]